MICIPITDKLQFKEAFQAIDFLKNSGKDAGLEIRLDLCHLLEKDLEKIPDLKGTDTILTYRCQDRLESGCTEEKVDCSACSSMMKLKSELIGSFEQLDLYYAEHLVCALIEKGAKYIDLGDEMPGFWKSRWKDLAKSRNCQIILSHHDFSGTEPVQTYLDFYDRAMSRGADLVKIVPTAKTTEEAISVLELYHHLPADRLIAFSMGTVGKFSRLEAWKYGSPVSYVALNPESTSASGQYDLTSFLREIDENHFAPIPDSCRKTGENSRISISIPSSKSFAQRLIICAALSGEKTELTRYTDCKDNRAAIQLARQLNTEAEFISRDDSSVRLKLTPSFLPREELTLDVGESGLCTRIAIALGAFFPQLITITGEGSVLKRSFAEECRILKELGIDCRSNSDHLPITVIGSFPKDHIAYEIRTEQSSQFASGLMIGCHFAEKTLGYPVHLNIGTHVSGHYLKITEECLKRFPAPSIVIEGDWSSAANLCTAAFLSGKEAVLENLHLPSSQPDSAIIPLLQVLGCRIEQTDNGIQIQGPKRRPAGFSFDATDTPDLFPLLAVLAMHSKGESLLKGIRRLTNKESNRLESIYCLLTSLYGDNLSLHIEDDALRITGIEKESGNTALCKSYNDHRIAMAAILCTLKNSGDIRLDQTECIGKSYPDFIRDISEFQ